MNPTAFLEMRSAEQAAVEERYSAECPRANRTGFHGRIQRSEEQRLQDSLLIGAALGDAAGISVTQESEIAVEPALGLEKTEEDQSGDVQERKLPPFSATDSPSKRVGQLADNRLKSPKESPGNCLSTENVEPPCVRR